MTILFVLLTFLLIMSITYFMRQDRPAVRPQPAVWPRAAEPLMARDFGFEIPKGYCFHPGHTWVLDEGRQNARIGLDSFAANLVGKVDRVEVAGLNRWVRQGQKVMTLTRDGLSVEMLSPIEGVIISVNPEIMKDPNLAVKDPYKDGWVCVIKSPEIHTNLNNLVQGPMVGPWMQNNLRRLSAMTQQLGPAVAQDGGLPVPGLLAQVEPGLQRSIMREFFLS
jgi:glycine cleavage system H lipoate-binding protein